MALKITATVLATVCLLGACATHRLPDAPDPGLPPDTSQKETVCNAGLAALIGGAIGAVIHEDDRTRGAAIGAGLGSLACAIINATTSELKSSKEVEGQYRTAHNGQLPDRALVAVYDTAYNANGSVRGGEPAKIVSSITVVPGANEPVREMREVLEVFEDERSGETMLKAEKSIENPGRGGALQNTFEVKLPERLAAGSYPATTTLFVNGQRAGENRGTLRVLARQ
jgi:hypothetical protein